MSGHHSAISRRPDGRDAALGTPLRLDPEIAHRNLLAQRAAEHRPQPHEQRRGAGEAPEAWHGASS